MHIKKMQEGLLYAEEAEVINLALFGTTSKEWRVKHPKLAKKGRNLRDEATVEQLTVLSNLESMNSMFITQGMDKGARLQLLYTEAKRQLEALLKIGKNIEPHTKPRLRLSD